MPKKKKEAPRFTSKATIKEYIRDAHALRVSGDFLEAIDDKFAAMLDAAADRTKDNKRGTVKPADF